MFNIKIADLVVSIDNKFPYIKDRCEGYVTEQDNDTGIVLSVTEERMQGSIDYKLKFDGETISFPEAEFDAIHYPLYEKLHEFGGFWLHSVLMEKGGQGFAFTAAPGTGKTTHAKLWLEAFDDAVVVNGDNTIIRKDAVDGLFYGYGTPFCGKEGLNKNCRVPLKAICFLERSETNYVEQMKATDAAMSMFKDNFCLRKEIVGDVMRLYIDLASQVSFYCVHCNIQTEAATVCYESICK